MASPPLAQRAIRTIDGPAFVRRDCAFASMLAWRVFICGKGKLISTWTRLSRGREGQARTTFSSNQICSFHRASVIRASFSVRLFSSSALCFCAFSCCRCSISLLFLCCELELVWLRVLRRPPNNRLPRFFSSSLDKGARRAVLARGSSSRGLESCAESCAGGSPWSPWSPSSNFALFDDSSAPSRDSIDALRFCVTSISEPAGSGLMVSAGALKSVSFSCSVRREPFLLYSVTVAMMLSLPTAAVAVFSATMSKKAECEGMRCVRKEVNPPRSHGRYPRA